jgi:hypothetical protein
MSKISTYSLADTPLQLSDRLIGTEAPRPQPTATPLATKNFSLGELLQLFSANFPAATLQAVLNAGNIATQNMFITGTIDVTLIKPTNIEDILGSQGTNFQFLSKATTGINWVNLPVDNLQAVLNAGNTATQNINLTGNITSTRIIPGNIQDYTTSIGTTGQVLTKSTSGIVWSNIPTSLTPGLNDVLLVGNTVYSDISIVYPDNGIFSTSYENGSAVFTNTGSGNYVIFGWSGIRYQTSTPSEFTEVGFITPSSNNIIQFPDASGTIALISNIPAAITLTTTGSSGSSTLIAGVLNVPTYTLSGLGGVPTSRTLTINGTAYDLTADRSWSVGTVTSVTATGQITSTGGTTPVISTLMHTNKLIGRSTAGTGVMEEITIGTGLTLSGGILNGSSSGVTSVGLTMPSAFTVTNSPITSSGTIAVTGAGTVSQYVRGDGTLANFPNSTGGGASVNYYLNGSVSQGTFGGATYYQMSKTPILGAGTNFTRTNGAGNGYIASFITDAGDPSFLNIPGGNWNLEFYFQSSSSGGSPQFYGEIYKVSATNVFTLVASGVSNPEGITNGTTVDQYFTSIPMPQTSLLITDRLAIRIYVITGGRTITLHTENGNLCEVLTTFTTGLTALNGLTSQVQYFTVGTSGTDFNISSATDTHTFNLPTASATNRGALSTTDWSAFNGKFNLPSLTSGSVLFSNGTTLAQDNANFFWDDTNNRLGIGTASPSSLLELTSATPRLTINDTSGIFGGALAFSNSGVLKWIIGAGQDGVDIDSLGIVNGSGASRLHIINSSGNVGIGTTTPTAKLHIAAPGALSTDIAFRVRNSADTINLMAIDGTGNITIGSSAIDNIISFGGNNNQIFRSSADGSFNFKNTFSNATVFKFRTNSDLPNANTSGTNVFMSLPIGYAPTSGTGTWTQLSLNPTINQTGGANGITRGLFINPTLTAAADFRAIETTVGNVILGSTSGNVGIGTTAPSIKLQVETSVNGSDGIWARNLNTGTVAFGYVVAASGVGTVGVRAHSAAHGVWPNTSMLHSATGFTGGLSIYQDGANPISLWTNATERMRITSAGNVGIGTSSPTEKLQVSGNSIITGNLSIGSSSSYGKLNLAATSFGTQTMAFVVADGTQNPRALISYITASGSQRVNFSSSYSTGSTLSNWTFETGNVGIGTTAPTAKLHIAAPGALSTDIALRVRNSADSADLLVTNGLGNVGIGTATPNQKLEVIGNAIFRSTNRIDINTAQTAVVGVLAGTSLGTYGNFSLISSSGLAGESTDISYWNGGTYYPAFRISNVASGFSNLLLMKDGGNVGIGTAIPSETLEVNSTANTGFAIRRNALSNSSRLFFKTSGTYNWSIGTRATRNDYSIFNESSVEAFTINATTNNILINTTTDVASSKLTIESTTQGVLFPRMTTTQKNAIATPATGLVVFDTTLNKLCVRGASAWETITSI